MEGGKGTPGGSVLPGTMRTGSFTVEHQCPQCGAPVVLEESDRLFTCSHCRVRLFFYAGTVFRYYLPPGPSAGDELLFAPYWHLRGALFILRPFEIESAFVDASFKAAGLSAAPPTLGVRPQAMKLRIAGEGVEGRFLRSSVASSDLLSKVVGRRNSGRSASEPATPFLRSFVGEATSLIYAPLSLRGATVRDAVLDRPLGELSEEDREVIAAPDDPSSWTATFLPALCPDCGWDLPGEKRSVAFICGSCGRGWQAEGGSLQPLNYGVQPGGERSDVYLPFWSMEVSIDGLPLSSRADLVRLANLPRAVRKEWEEETLHFWAPAFHLRPGIFLRLARQLTSTFIEDQMGSKLPRKGECYPVTIEGKVAFESVPFTVAGLAVPKKDVFPLLAQLKVRRGKTTLLYIPFSIRAGDYIQERYGISFRRNSLRRI